MEWGVLTPDKIGELFSLSSLNHGTPMEFSFMG
jgi:hypothetical protein